MIDANIPLAIAAQFVADCTGSCPHDHTDGEWEREGGCESACAPRIEKKCWSIYFTEKAKEEAGRE